MQLIGITGGTNTGKDTAAAYIARKYGYVTVSFADKLKQIVKDLYDFEEESLWGPSALRDIPDSRYPREDGSCMAPRDPLKTIGTEGARAAYSRTWIEAYGRTVDKLRGGGWGYERAQGIYPRGEGYRCHGVITPDTRFVNEMAYIRSAGGLLLRITRPQDPSRPLPEHASEAEQRALPDAYFDSVIRNDTTLEAFYAAIDRFFFLTVLAHSRKTA